MRFVLVTMIALQATAATAGELAGNWSGSGYLMPKSGAKENVQCRVGYEKQTATVFRVSATCATASVKIIQTGEVLEVGADRYVGDFYNPQFDASGRVRVQLAGSRQSVTFSGPLGHGALTLSKK